MNKFLLSLTILSILFVSGCKKDDPAIPQQQIEMSALVLGGTENFAVLAGAAVTNTGATTIVGDLGLSPGTSVAGFPPGILNGTLRVNDVLATQAKLDLTTAYNEAAGRISKDMVSLSGNIGGLTLTPGLYRSTSALEISSGNVTFDALGKSDAVFILQIASTFTTTPGRQVVLAGGAKAANIYWQVSSSASFGTTTVMKGTILAMESITFDTGAMLEGKALARDGAITLDANSIVKK